MGSPQRGENVRERRAASRALAEARTAKANERAAAKAAKRAVAPTEGLV